MGMGDRSMAVVVEPGMQPDLAEGQWFGTAGLTVEPAIGSRKVLTILHDPHREGVGAPAVRPSKAAIQNALFGPVGSTRDYFETVSGGRFTIEDVGVTDWLDACKPWQHYWNVGGTHNCGGQGSFDCGFSDGSLERYFEALWQADATVDFSQYDTNSDGIIDWQNKLAIIIVLPQNSGKGKIWNMIPFCVGDPLIQSCALIPNTVVPTLDGVQIRVVASWATNLSAPFVPEVPTHELGHELLGLGDMYTSDDNPADARRMSLMADNLNTSSYIDAMHRLALGWAEPRMITADGVYQLEDVRTNEVVYVLPRVEGGDGREFYLLENRQSEQFNPLYDTQTGDQGIALWHIVESPAKVTFPPGCVSQNDWNSYSPGGAPYRLGIRLVRPYYARSVFDDELWCDMNYDIADAGRVCPAPNDDYLQRRNVLEWFDSVPSGYGISNWSAPGPIMSFEVNVPD